MKRVELRHKRTSGTSMSHDQDSDLLGVVKIPVPPSL